MPTNPRVSDLQLLRAYSFLEAHRRKDDALEIRSIAVRAFSASGKTRWDRKVRQHMACEALKQAGLFREFASRSWPTGLTPAGDDRMRYYREKYESHIAAEGHPFPSGAGNDKSSVSQITGGPIIRDIPIGEQDSEGMVVHTKDDVRKAELRERKLVKAYKGYLIQKRASSVTGLQITPPGAHDPISCDLYERGRNNLIEAKADTSRESIRMAIGQLADYSRFLESAPNRGVLTPTRPSADLERLLASQEISCVWRDVGGGFVDNADGRFV
jgi:hypothetical protein